MTKKTKILSIVVILITLAGLNWYFGGPGPLGPGYEKPPQDPEARKALLSENIDNMGKEFVSIDYEVPSWKELDKINQSLSNERKYPEFIKALQTYGTLPNLVEVLYFGDVLKDLGVNTQFVHANYWWKKGDFEFWYLGYDRPKDLSQDESKRALIHNILLAKQQGLAVVLFPDYFQLEDGGMTELGVSDDLEGRLETIALELAQIAEDYNVEYLVPSNQIEMILDTNGYSVEESQRRTNAFYEGIVPKIKQIYSGKVMYKMGGFRNWSNYNGISLAGADIFGFTGCYNQNRDDVSFVASDIKTAAAQANKLSQKYGIPWINAEFVITDEESPVDNRKVAQVMPIEDYYQAGLNAFRIYGKNAVGFTIHSLLGSGKVYDTKAMPLIKDFFATR